MDICRWNYLNTSESIRKQEFNDSLPRASVRDLGVILMGVGCEGLVQGVAVYLVKTLKT
ncbi:hypothetical protein Sjap_005911 [Stephania japonica]|uniref:Uncharacterized protein n=1 Tax=Stephania japonica TaxID=461633 RepID=A0AAP0K4X8_9MAGN